MTKKRKKDTNTSEGRMGTDPVRVQIAIKVKRPKGVQISKELVQKAIDRWANTGKQTKGIEISSVEWQNYARNKPTRIAKSGEEIEEARRSLHLGRLLRSGYAGIQAYRKN